MCRVLSVEVYKRLLLYTAASSLQKKDLHEFISLLSNDLSSQDTPSSSLTYSSSLSLHLFLYHPLSPSVTSLSYTHSKSPTFNLVFDNSFSSQPPNPHKSINTYLHLPTPTYTHQDPHANAQTYRHPSITTYIHSRTLQPTTAKYT